VYKFIRKYPVLFCAALAAVLIAYPFLLPDDFLRGMSTKILLYIVIVSSMNVVNGYSGQFTMGHAGFLAAGAYTAAILMTRCGFSFWLALPLAGFAAALCAAAAGFLGSILSGLYLAMVTLGFSEILRIIALNWISLTGGPLGIKGIPPPKIAGWTLRGSYPMYFLMLALAALMLFFTWRVINSKYGKAWISIRENEAAAASLGINIRKYKIMNMAYAGFWAGIAGAFIAVYYRYIDSTMFGIDENCNILAMTIVGGMGTFAGPFAGVIAVNVISEVFRFASEYRLVIYAVLIILMMHIRPQGLAGISENANRLKNTMFLGDGI
jgi:branched-chain amino acid transport system permease protein